MSCGGRGPTLIWTCAAALLLLLIVPALAKAPVDPPKAPDDPPAAGIITHDFRQGQLPGIPLPPRLPGYGPFERLPSVDESPWLVLATRRKPYWTAGAFDPFLSNACALGDFSTSSFNSMVVRFTAPEGAAQLQVVLPDHRHLLYDRRALARPNETYFFMSTGDSHCQVWVVGGKPRALPPNRGTSVAKPDPQALKKKLKAIDGWPE